MQEVSKILPRTKTTIAEYNERKAKAKEKHILAVANKEDRMFFDRAIANNARTQILFKLAQARQLLLAVRELVPCWKHDIDLTNDITRVRKATRILAQRVRGPNDTTDYGID